MLFPFMRVISPDRLHQRGRICGFSRIPWNFATGFHTLYRNLYNLPGNISRYSHTPRPYQNIYTQPTYKCNYFEYSLHGGQIIYIFITEKPIYQRHTPAAKANHNWSGCFAPSVLSITAKTSVVMSWYRIYKYIYSSNCVAWCIVLGVFCRSFYYHTTTRIQPAICTSYIL